MSTMRTVILSLAHRDSLKNKVMAIKAVRGLALIGLKEAKELVESVLPGKSEIIHVSHSVLEPDFSRNVSGLKEAGMEVRVNLPNNSARKGLADEIQKLVTYATMSGQYDIGKALIDVLQTHCPYSVDAVPPSEE